MYDNFTGNGILGRIVERRAEVAISSMYMWWVRNFTAVPAMKRNYLETSSCRYHEYLFMEFSTQVSRTGVTTLVPKPK